MVTDLEAIPAAVNVTVIKYVWFLGIIRERFSDILSGEFRDLFHPLSHFLFGVSHEEVSSMTCQCQKRTVYLLE